MRQEERKTQTTQRLLESAAKVFSRLGFREATVDDVAEAGGYTKGAVYGNFGGKDALLLALIDQHLDEQLTAIDSLLATNTGSDLRTDLRDAPTQASGSEFGLLMLEIWHYAARNEEARTALAARYQLIRSRLAEAIAEQDAMRGTSDSRDATEVASLVLAVDAGLFLQGLIDPGAVSTGLRSKAIANLVDPRVA